MVATNPSPCPLPGAPSGAEETQSRCAAGLVGNMPGAAVVPDSETHATRTDFCSTASRQVVEEQRAEDAGGAGAAAGYVDGMSLYAGYFVMWGGVDSMGRSVWVPGAGTVYWEVGKGDTMPHIAEQVLGNADAYEYLPKPPSGNYSVLQPGDRIDITRFVSGENPDTLDDLVPADALDPPSRRELEGICSEGYELYDGPTSASRIHTYVVDDDDGRWDGTLSGWRTLHTHRYNACREARGSTTITFSRSKMATVKHAGATGTAAISLGPITVSQTSPSVTTAHTTQTTREISTTQSWSEPAQCGYRLEIHVVAQSGTLNQWSHPAHIVTKVDPEMRKRQFTLAQTGYVVCRKKSPCGTAQGE